MARRTKGTVSFQDLGNGTYRVVGAIRRNAVTGRVVVKAKGRPDSSAKQMSPEVALPSRSAK